MDNRRRIQRGACRRFSARGSQPRHGSPRVSFVRKLRAGMMPPAGRPRPGSGELDELAGWLEDRLDEATRR